VWRNTHNRSTFLNSSSLCHTRVMHFYNTININQYIYTEVVILIASNFMSIWCLLIITCFILLLFKIITLRRESLNDIRLFSVKSKIFENNKKRESFWILLYLLHLCVFLHSRLFTQEGWGWSTHAVRLPQHHSRAVFLNRRVVADFQRVVESF